jgi:hypothetical protein
MRDDNPPEDGPGLTDFYRSAADWAEHRVGRAVVPQGRGARERRPRAVRPAAFGIVAAAAAVATIGLTVPNVLGPRNRSDSVELATGTGNSASPGPGLSPSRAATATKPARPVTPTAGPTQPASLAAGPSAPPIRTVSVYLPRIIGTGCGSLVSVSRAVPVGNVPESAVQALFAAPTKPERRAGLSDALTGAKATTKVIDRRMIIDFAALPNKIDPACREVAVDNPVRRTAKQFERSVTRVRITLRGSERRYQDYLAGRDR